MSLEIEQDEKKGRRLRLGILERLRRENQLAPRKLDFEVVSRGKTQLIVKFLRNHNLAAHADLVSQLRGPETPLGSKLGEPGCHFHSCDSTLLND